MVVPSMPMPNQAAQPEHIIRVERLTRSFGDLKAVNDVTLDVRRGETIGLLGPCVVLISIGLAGTAAGVIVLNRATD